MIDSPGELVITKPMPSMPVFFWNDDDGSRYRAAYFDKYPGVWCHGDWLTITDRESVVVHGRSDATLNRSGMRMGSAEIYNAVECCRGQRLPGGRCGDKRRRLLDAAVRLAGRRRRTRRRPEAQIVAAIRTGASPRHVPDAILVVPGIPRTMTGKRLEIPIKRILLGAKPADVVSPTSVDRPDLLAGFAEYAKA